MKKLLLSLFAVAFSLGMSAQTNLLENGDFETWTDGVPANWGSAASVASNATISQETANVHGGSYAVKIAATTQNKRLAYKPMTLKAGTYTLSYYAYGNQVKQGYAILTDGKVADTQKDYVYTSTSNTVLDDGAWTNVTVDFTLEESKTVSIIIMRQKKSTDDGLIVDDVTLTTTDGGIDESGSGSGTDTPDTGDGIANTAETAYTVAEAHAIIAAGNDLDTEVYVKGIVTSVTNFAPTYGSITYYLGDTADDSNPLQIYSGLYYNGDKFSSKNDLQVGDEIVVKGLLKSYNGTDEMDKNSVVITHKRDGKDVTPSGSSVDISNTPDKAYTVAKAIELIDAGEGLTTSVYVKGYIVGTPSVSTSYGNANYTISDVKDDETTTLSIYRGYYLNDEKFTSEDQIATGDEVVVYGCLTLYGTTYEMAQGNYLYSLNGETTGISTVEEAKAENAPVYNMAGQRVNASAKGLLIQNGKKFIRK